MPLEPARLLPSAWRERLARHCAQFDEAFQSWDVDPALLFTAQTVKKPTSGAVVAHLQREARGCEHLVLWLDCDREGENIAFEVMHNCVPSMRTRSGQQVWRARFSAVSEASIRAAMDDLGEPNENEASAVDARQELDLRVGVAFTRFQCRYFKGRFRQLEATTLSYGPCQTPTLAFVVRRHLEILSFVEERFWSLELELALPPGRAVPSPRAAGAEAPCHGVGMQLPNMATSHGVGMQLPNMATSHGVGGSAAASIAPRWSRGRVFEQRVGEVLESMAARESAARVSAVEAKQ